MRHRLRSGKPGANRRGLEMRDELMALRDRLPFRRKTNPPPAPTTQQRFAFLTETLIDRFSMRRITKFLDDLEKTESWWPIVLPLLAWVGWRTYRNERRKVLEERAFIDT